MRKTSWAIVVGAALWAGCSWENNVGELNPDAVTPSGQDAGTTVPAPKDIELLNLSARFLGRKTLSNCYGGAEVCFSYRFTFSLRQLTDTPSYRLERVRVRFPGGATESPVLTCMGYSTWAPGSTYPNTVGPIDVLVEVGPTNTVFSFACDNTAGTDVFSGVTQIPQGVEPGMGGEAQVELEGLLKTAARWQATSTAAITQ
jgi:hypothetical protein